MRRRDVLTLAILGSVIWYSWQKLQPPSIEEENIPVDYAAIAAFSKWTTNQSFQGKVGIETAQAQTTETSGEVKGATTEPPVPQPILPVEEYYGSPFVTTLEGMLGLHQVTVYPEDVVEAFPPPEMGIGSTIRIYRATPIIVTDWGKEKQYRTWTKTVKDFFAENKVELGENDRVEPGLETELKTLLSSLTESPKDDSDRGSSIQSASLLVKDDKIVRLTITRVAVTEVKQEEKIDFKKIEKEDPELPRGQTKVTKGEFGKRVKTFRVTRENGAEVKRELIKTEVTKEPKDEVKIIGTKVLIGKTYTGKASWYKFNSTKVATDHFKRGTNLRITNLTNGKQIFVKNDGCICSDSGYVVDLHPDHFTALGGRLTDGVMKSVKIDEVLN